MSLTNDELIDLIEREINAFRTRYGVMPTYASAALGLGAPDVTNGCPVYGVPVHRTISYGLGSDLCVEVGISTRTPIAHYTLTHPSGCDIPVNSSTGTAYHWTFERLASPHA